MDVRLLGLGLLLLLLFLLGWCTLGRTLLGFCGVCGVASNGACNSVTRCLCKVLGFLLLALLALSALLAGQRCGCSACAGSGSSSGLLLLLLALLLGLCVNGLDLEDDVVQLDVDLLVKLQAKDRRVLDEVDVTDDVVVALLAGPLLCAPLRDDGRELLVEGNVCDRGLCAEDGGPAGEVCVQRRQALGRLCSII